MKKLFKKIKHFFKRLLAHIPTRLPISFEQMDIWYRDIVETFNLPDAPTYKRALVSMIMQQDATTIRVPKYYFAKSVWKAMSGQIAYEVVHAINKLEEENMKAAKAKVQSGQTAEAV